MKIDTTNIFPTGNRLLIKIRETERETETGLITADTATNSAPVVGEVIRSGEKAKFDAGQTVMFRRYSVDEVRVQREDGEDDIFYFIEDEDVLGEIRVDDLVETNKYGQIAEKKGLARENNYADEQTKEGGEEGEKIDSLQDASEKAGEEV